jgi:hypothetical protein
MSSSSPADRAEPRPARSGDFEVVIAGVLICVAASIIIPPAALFVVLVVGLFKFTRRFDAFWGNLKLYWRRNLRTRRARVILAAAAVCVLPAIPFYLTGSLPDVLAIALGTGLTFRNVVWLTSSVLFAIAGLILLLLLHVLAMKPKKVGVVL